MAVERGRAGRIVRTTLLGCLLFYLATVAFVNVTWAEGGGMFGSTPPLVSYLLAVAALLAGAGVVWLLLRTWRRP